MNKNLAAEATLDWATLPYSGPGINKRRAAYLASAIMIPGAFTVAWTLVALGVVDPMPIDKYVSVSLFLGYWAALFAFVDNQGEHRSWQQKWHEFLVIWLITSGCAELLWELPVVYMKVPFMYQLGAELKPDEWFFWPWWLYAVADTRYMRPHEAQLAHEALLAHFGFFEIAAAYLLSRGRYYKTALSMAILANWGAFYGNTSVIYLGEMLVGFRNIEDGAAGFWLKWLGLNLQWSVLSPIAALGALWLLVQRSRVEGAIAQSEKVHAVERQGGS